jgi:hypothetical protein
MRRARPRPSLRLHAMTAPSVFGYTHRLRRIACLCAAKDGG